MPGGKFTEVRERIRCLLACRKVRLRVFGEVVGHLSFMCKVIAL